MRKNRSLAILSGSLIFCLGIYILFQGGTQITEEWKGSLRENLVRMTERSFMPGLFYAEKEEKTDWNTWIAKKAMQMIPLGSYVEGKGTYESEIEDTATYEMIMARQAADENEVDENGNTDQRGRKSRRKRCQGSENGTSDCIDRAAERF